MPELELNCVQCKEIFLFSEKEQEDFYRLNRPQPQRCAKCRPTRRKLQQAAASGDAKKRYEIVCDRCGRKDSVPFMPKAGREVLCGTCHGASQSRSRNA